MIHRCNSRCKGGNHWHHWMDNSSNTSSSSKKMPDPYNFEITDVKEFGDYQLLLVKYPGVTTFKGMKCLVVKCTMIDLVKAKSLDPHFYDGRRINSIKIVARFPPDSEGVEHATQFARALSNGVFGTPAMNREVTR